MTCAVHSKHGNNYCHRCATPGTAGLLDTTVSSFAHKNCSGTQTLNLWLSGSMASSMISTGGSHPTEHKSLFLLMSKHKLCILGTIVCRSNSTHPKGDTYIWSGELCLHLLHHPEGLTHCGCLPCRTSQVQQDDATNHTSVPPCIHRGARDSPLLAELWRTDRLLT